MKSGVLLVFSVGFLLLGCSNKMQTREAVQRGILKSVSSKGITPDAMDVTLTSVKFHGDHADAVVAFAPKGGKITDGVTMRYSLEQRDNEWVVTNRSGFDMKQHTGGMQTPPPVMDQNSGAVSPIPGSLAAPSGSLPAGHPPVGGASSDTKSDGSAK